MRSHLLHLEDASTEALPGWPGLHLLTLLVNQVPVKLTAASVNIHLGGPEPSLALPQETRSPEDKDDRESEIRLEEGVSSSNTIDINW